MLQWIWEYKYLFEILISFSLDIWPVLILLDHLVVLLLFLRKPCTVFQIGYTNFILINNVPLFLSSPILSATLVISCLFEKSHSNEFKVISNLWLGDLRKCLFLSAECVCVCLVTQLCPPLCDPLVAQMVKNLPAMRETQVWSPS